jgi:hypothetical protein|tara:strand:- start:259 stop:435 length:177 start_codon:yes stop_codon:yes gene_type:complete
MKNDINRCCLCRSSLNGEYGHNALPVKKGRCCDECNSYIVIPKRIEDIATQQTVWSTK